MKYKGGYFFQEVLYLIKKVKIIYNFIFQKQSSFQTYFKDQRNLPKLNMGTNFSHPA